MGAIGTAVAGALSAQGEHELLLCSRRELRATILVRLGRQEPIELVAARAFEAHKDLRPADWVLVAVKAHQTESAAPWLSQLAGPSTIVVALQNGIEQVPAIASIVGDLVVLPSAVWVGSEQLEDGSWLVRPQGRLCVPNTPAGRAFRELLSGTWITVELVDDFQTEAWRKLCKNAIASLEALVGRPAGIFRIPEVAEVAHRYACECIAVARADGASIDPAYADDAIAQLAELHPDSPASILRDRQADRPLEWDALNGVVRRVAARHGLATPVGDIIVPLLQAASTESMRGGR
jgi:2-dehydropantoate 2-reductase